MNKDQTTRASSPVTEAGSAIGSVASEIKMAATDKFDEAVTEVRAKADDAKARVWSARRAAHEARLSSEVAFRRGARAAADFIEGQPLVLGALAMAVGAAIGGVLPRSRIEDDPIGKSSDHRFADAPALFREERDKAMATARTAAEEVKDEISDVWGRTWRICCQKEKPSAM